MTTLRNNLPQVWDLEKIFPGGSNSKQLSEHIERLEKDIAQLTERLTQLSSAPEAKKRAIVIETVTSLQKLSTELTEAGAFGSCSVAQNVEDEQARVVSGRVRQLSATLDAALTSLDEAIVSLPEDEWGAFLQDDAIVPIRFAMQERRHRAEARMEPDKEALAVELGVDGYHGWGQMYNLISGRMRVLVKEGDEEKELSVGQAANRFGDPDRSVRQHVFTAYEEAWSKEADLLAPTLNNLAGYRLTLYRYRGWDEVLQEPLELNRMERATLEAMWGAVGEGKELLVQYMDAKARLLGREKLSWFDVTAPVGGTSDEKIAYDDAAKFIVDQFARFGSGLQKLAVTAFNDGWIEAEDRPGKGAGGFCTTFPLTGESRIFLTYGGRPQSVDTLAHELGHAYHSHVMRDLPLLARRYPMNLAETASTLAEMIVADGSLAAADGDAQRLSLLDNRLQRAVAFFMDIHSRFLFETNFYDARRRGPVSVGQLNELMEEAQKKAFHGALDTYHPLFWASKLHFHITYMPFYNFPYTFGYLFSAGIYARRDEYGDRFPEIVDNLLRDTGRMRVEQLARTHLGVDLGEPDFWREAVRHVLADVEQFEALVR